MNESNSHTASSAGRLVPGGCAISAMILALVIGIAGYISYRILADAVEIPEELQPYAERESMLALVESHEPAPGPDERLTGERVRLFVGALDSVGYYWDQARGMLDSIDPSDLANDTADGTIGLWETPTLVSRLRRVPFYCRMGLVGYLNRAGLSWEEYLWLKERTVAASGIVHSEVDSTFGALVASYFGKGTRVRMEQDEEGEERPLSRHDQWFRQVEKLRASGAIDSAEWAAVQPYRDVLLQKGLPVLMGFEMPPETDASDPLWQRDQNAQ